MASRIRWLGIGVSLGSIFAIRIERRIRRQLSSLSGDSVVNNTLRKMERLASDLSESWREGISSLQDESAVRRRPGTDVEMSIGKFLEKVDQEHRMYESKQSVHRILGRKRSGPVSKRERSVG